MMRSGSKKKSFKLLALVDAGEFLLLGLNQRLGVLIHLGDLWVDFGYLCFGSCQLGRVGDFWSLCLRLDGFCLLDGALGFHR